MKAIYRTVFSVFILLPCLMLGYQNCSNFESNDGSKSNNPNDSQTKASSLFEGKPVFMNDLSLLNYRASSDCSPDSIDALTVYNPEAHICAQANNSCEAFFLLNEGFSENQNQICDDTVDPNDESFKSSLKLVRASATGFKTSPGQICSLQFAAMIHFGLRQCSSGSNGCEIGFLKNKGFVEDSTSLCSF